MKLVRLFGPLLVMLTVSVLLVLTAPLTATLAVVPLTGMTLSVLLPLKVQRRPDRAAWAERAMALLRTVGLADFARSYPSELSGGMQQRVGMARALVHDPSLLLMDEPFGALDALTRARLQDELMAICAATQATVVMVTHDVDEAVLLSDRIVMLTNGPAATIGEVLRVDLPRPRERLHLAHDASYMDYRSQVIEFLYAKQQHPLAA